MQFVGNKEQKENVAVMRNQILNTCLCDHQIGLFYIGQVGYIIKYQNQYYMIDAYLSDYVDRNCCTDEVKWERNYPAPILPEELDFIDYVFCTHAHFDHTDPDTLRTLAQINKKAKYIMPASEADVLLDYGIPGEQIIRANVSEKLTLGTAIVTPIASAHEQLNPDNNGGFREMGYRFCFGECVVYHAGDCCIYDGLATSLGKLHIAMLPVNGRDYYRLSRDIIGNVTAPEAIELAEETQAELLIPMHFDLYDCNGISAASFVDAHERAKSKIPYHIFQPGEKYIFG